LRGAYLSSEIGLPSVSIRPYEVSAKIASGEKKGHSYLSGAVGQSIM